MGEFVGKPLETITLNNAGSDHLGEYTEGLTDNYLPIRLRGNHPSNRWIPATIEGVLDGALIGIAS
jgi:hypothetical protein